MKYHRSAPSRLTDWYLNNDDALRSILGLLDTAGPPAQAYENRKGQLSLLGIDWVVNLTRPATNLGPAVGIDVYTEQSASVDVESQINAATAEVSNWTATTVVNVVWFTPRHMRLRSGGSSDTDCQLPRRGDQHR